MAERRRSQPGREDLAGAASPPDLDLQSVSFSEVKGVDIVPGQVIRGIPRVSDYDDVERQVYLHLLRTAYPTLRISRRFLDFIITNDGISEELRPEGFQGNLGNGRATIAPFDADLAIEYKPDLKKRLQARMKKGDTPGLRVHYEGDLLRGVNQTQVGSISQDVIYFYDILSADSPDTAHLYRVFGPATERDKVSQVMRRSVEASVRSARSLRAGGYRDVDRGRAPSAGSPGLGNKRR